MNRPKVEGIINGTYGSVWWDGEQIYEVESFEAKLTPNYEDVNMAGSPATYKKGMGYSGDGTLTLKKIFSRPQQKMASQLRKGIFPRFTLAGKLADPEAYGTERVILQDVTINEIMLMKFEQKTLGSVEIPFNFSDYDMPDLIEA